MANKTVTVRPSGGTYTSLAAAITGEVSANADLTAAGMNGILTISIEGTWSSADTSASSLSLDGFTVDSTHYLNIVCTATGYSFEASGQYIAAISAYNTEYIHMRGFAVKNTHAQGATAISSSKSMVLDSMTVSGYAEYEGIGIRGGRVVNCVVKGVAGIGIKIDGYTYDGQSVVYNNTVGGCGSYGIRIVNAPTYLRNNYSGGNTGADYSVSGATVTWQTNYSEDGTGTTSTAPYSTSTFTNVTPGSEDFSLVTGSDLIGTGTDLSADSTYPFDWDITGAERTSWDVGATYFEFVNFELESYTPNSVDSIDFALQQIGSTGISCAGIASTAAIGQPVIEATVSSTGIASTAQFGQPQVGSLDHDIVASGIASTAAIGSAAFGATVANIGIASTAVFGSQALGSDISASGIASTSALGQPVISSGIGVAGIASTSAIGSVALGAIVSSSGIASTASVGQPFVDTLTGIICQSIASTSAFGNASIGAEIATTGLASTVAYGSPSIGSGILAQGIVSSVVFGSPAIGANIYAQGIATTVACGSPSIALAIMAESIASVESAGNPALAASILSNGIAATDIFGLPIIGALPEGLCRVSVSVKVPSMQLSASSPSISASVKIPGMNTSSKQPGTSTTSSAPTITATGRIS